MVSQIKRYTQGSASELLDLRRYRFDFGLIASDQRYFQALAGQL